MNQKRYVIVMVDKVLNCPIYVGITGFCKVNDGACDDCKMKTEKGNYGDTKEQLEIKIQNAITRFFFKKSPNLPMVEKNFILEVIKEHKKLAKEIVECLGVK